GASLARVQRPCMRRRSRACAAPVRMLCFGTAPRRTAMEFRLIDRIRERTAQTRDDVRLGIGDDAALLAVPAGQELAVAIDTLVEGVHFPVGTAPADVGWKALAVNLSDLAAMGATPAWALLALTLPRPDAAFIDGLADGFAQLARPHRLALVGGDTTRGPLTLSVAVHGFVPPGQALTRAGARGRRGAGHRHAGRCGGGPALPATAHGRPDVLARCAGRAPESSGAAPGGGTGAARPRQRLHRRLRRTARRPRPSLRCERRGRGDRRGPAAALVRTT